MNSELSAAQQMRLAAVRAHQICYEVMLAHPAVPELQDDGLLHDAIHDILRADGGYLPAERDEWRCFHCDERFHDTASATKHFGSHEYHQPACLIDVDQVRAQEAELARYREEDSDKDRAMARLRSGFATELLREEERGYARGLADARKHPEEAATATPRPVPKGMLAWAVGQWYAQVAYRPLVNIHRQTLDNVWRQVIRHCDADDIVLIGPRHQDLLRDDPEEMAVAAADGHRFGAAVLNLPDRLHPNTAALVARFASALAEKLAMAQDKYGYSDGWAQSDWMDECRAKLLKHIGKGDPRDVAAYCAFLWHHGESTAAAPSRADAVGDTSEAESVPNTIYAVRLGEGSIAMHGPYVLATESEAQADRMAQARDGVVLPYCAPAAEAPKAQPRGCFDTLLRAVSEAGAKSCESGGFNNIDEVTPYILERYDAMLAAAPAAQGAKCICDGATYAPDQKAPFLVNRSCPSHGERTAAAQEYVEVTDDTGEGDIPTAPPAEVDEAMVDAEPAPILVRATVVVAAEQFATIAEDFLHRAEPYLAAIDEGADAGDDEPSKTFRCALSALAAALKQGVGG